MTSGAIYEAFVWSETDYDYYYVDVSSGGIFEAILRFTPPDYDYYYLNLYDDRARVVATGNTISDGVTHIVENDLSPGRYYLLVRSASGSNQSVPYQLQVVIPG